MYVVVTASNIHDLATYCHVDFADQVILHPVAQALKLLDSISREPCPVPRNCPPCAREYPFRVVGHRGYTSSMAMRTGLQFNLKHAGRIGTGK